MTSGGTAATRRACRSRRRAKTRCCSTWAPGCATSARRFRPIARSAGNCLLSHLHWDHVQGLPFFVPLLREGACLDVYGPTQDDGRIARRSRVVHDPAAVVPGQRRRVARHSALSRHRRTRSSRSASSRSCHASFRTSARRSDSASRGRVVPSRTCRIISSRSTAASLHRPSALELIDGVDLLIHDAQYTQDRVPGQVDVGSLHDRLRRVAGRRGRCQAAGAVPSRSVTTR